MINKQFRHISRNLSNHHIFTNNQLVISFLSQILLPLPVTRPSRRVLYILLLYVISINRWFYSIYTTIDKVIKCSNAVLIAHTLQANIYFSFDNTQPCCLIHICKFGFEKHVRNLEICNAKEITYMNTTTILPYASK